MAARRYGGKSGEERDRERRERLIDAGCVVFGRVGFATATVAHLCREAHVSLRSYHQVFGVKEEVLSAVVNRCIGDAVRAIRKGLVTGDDVWGLLRGAVATYVEYVTSRRAVYRLLYVESCHLANGEPRRDPLAIVLADILRGQTTLPERSLRVIVAAVAGMVAALLAQWHGSECVAKEEIIETAMRFCSSALASGDA
ncbi:MAG TPA: hypothetical protein VFV66_32960 [Nonomuraea sp.]|nr:hypothetical protein [Nonomuraea sp.]